MTGCASKTLLVTGASGFLGAQIVTAAREAGWRVRALVRSPRPFPTGVEVFIGNLADRDVLRKACAETVALIHAAGLAHVFGSAAEDPERFVTTNESGTANLIEAALAQRVSTVVLVSSVSVYGHYVGQLCDERQPCDPKGAYATSKWRAERRAIEAMRDSSSSLTILRFSTIYGEGDRGNIAKLIRSLAQGMFVWPGRGLNQKSLIYKNDAARACIRAVDFPRRGVNIFNVTSPPVSMNEIVSAICDVLHRPIPRVRIPSRVLNAVGATNRLFGDPWQIAQSLRKFLRDDAYDGSRFNSAFQFEPEIQLIEGIRREIEHMRLASSLPRSHNFQAR